MAQVYRYQYKGKQTTKQDKCTTSIPLDKSRIWLDFNEGCGGGECEEAPIYLFSQDDIVNDSDGNDVELYEGLEVSVFDYDFDEGNQPDAILAEGLISSGEKSLVIIQKSLILYLITKQIGGALYGVRSENFIFARRTGKARNPRFCK